MKGITRLLWILVILGTVVAVGLTLWLSVSAMFFSFTLDYGEGDVFWFTHQLALGQNIYKTLNGPPFDAANYPPVAMLMAAVGYPLFGDSLVVGRWLSFAAALVAAAFVVRFVRGETTNTRIGILAAGLFLGSTFVYHWMPLYRVDLIGVAFCLGGIYCVWRWERETWGEQRRAYLGLAALLFLLALYTKHSLFFAPAAAVVAVWLRNRTSAIVFAVGLGVVGALVFAGLEIATRGGWSFGILGLNATVWTPRVFVPLVSSFFTTYLVLIGLAVWAWLGRVRAKKVGVLELYAVASVLAIALAGREGAWENYFLEPIAMGCVFAGIGLARIIGGGNAAWRWVAPVLVLAQLGLFVNEHDPRVAQKLFAEVRAGNEHAGPLVRGAQGTVIAEDMGLLWGNGKPVEYYSFVYSTLARAGRYDQKWELDNLRAGNFPYVVLNQGTRQDVDAYGNFTHAFVGALDYGYAVASSDARYVIYAPAPLEYFDPKARFGETFELVGWSEERQDGNELVLTVVWQALQKPNARYTTFAHLETAEGEKLGQDDHEPQGGAYPTVRWEKDEMVRDTYRIKLPATIPPGKYLLRVGWYDTVTEDLLSTNGGGDFAELSTFEVK